MILGGQAILVGGKSESQTLSYTNLAVFPVPPSNLSLHLHLASLAWLAARTRLDSSPYNIGLGGGGCDPAAVDYSLLEITLVESAKRDY